MSRNILSTVLTAALGLGLYTALPSYVDTGIAYASAMQDDDKKKPTGKSKRIKVLTPKTAKKISKVAEYYELKDLAGAMSELMDLKSEYDRGKMNGYDSAIMWQYIGIIRYEQDNLDGTIEAYEKFLSHKDDVHDGLVLQMQYGLGQLYFSRGMEKEGAAQKKDLQKSLSLLTQWEKDAEVISVGQYYFLSQIYYVLEDFKKVLHYIDIVIKESWYKSRLSAYYELQDFPNMKKTLIELIVSWPSPTYWWQLSSTYNELNDEPSFFAVTEVIYQSGYFEKPNHYTMLAQIFMAQEVPIKAAWILEFALKKKILSEDKESLKLLGQAYLMSQEYKKAISPLSRVAALEKDYQLWMQVGQVQQSLDNLKGAAEAFDKSLAIIPAKEKKDEISLYILMGNVLTEMRQYSDARKAFDTAKNLSPKEDKKKLDRWIKYWDGEKKRWELMQP
jgi:tetratricopeptide (TPR) repeat protein